jgi:ribonuclease G
LPLRWFRRRKEREEQAPSQAAASAVAEPESPTVVDPAGGPGADGQVTVTPPKRRRRGSRGGRGRKRQPGAGTSAPVEAAEQKAAPTEVAPAPKAKPERKRSREATRARPPRRTPPRRAPLPKARRELLVSVDPGEKRVAMLEDDVVAEVYLERPEQRSIAGNVYLGTVDNVLPGMEAAFVEIGLEKNGFLYVDEIVGPELEGRRGARKIQDLIQRGQTILVQAVKDPMKTKGARLTTEISLPGRFVVFVPHGDGHGVSRRLEDDERNRLKAIVKDLAPKQGGVIVRTAAEGASAEDIARDLDFLQRLWKTIETRAKSVQAPALIYQEAELPLRVTRDVFMGDFERLIVDHDRTYKRIVGYLKKTSPHMVERVSRYKDRTPLMEAFGVEQEVRSTLNRRVDLPSGGYLIFDYAEAFTVIDVNTGRFVGSRSKKSGGRLEDTITQNNLEAVKEVVRQLRLRDIGGIIVIDFIDMANPKNREQVEEALRQELERDRTKTYVVEISPLGLVEMTRQNVTDGPREVMTRKCPTCAGDGIVVSEDTTAVEIERKLRSLVTPGSRAKAYKVELNAKIASLLIGPGGSRLRELEDLTRRRFFLVGIDDVHLDHFRLLDRGGLEKVAPAAAPFEVGQELDVKLGEIGLYDSSAGVGRLKGYEVCVGDSANLVGKKVRVRVTAVMDGIAYAERVISGGEAELPITAEAEAERPMRAPRRVGTKGAEQAPEAAAEPAEEPIVGEVAQRVRPARKMAAAGTGGPARKPSARKPAAPRKAAVEAAAAVEEESLAAKKAPSRAQKRKPAEAEAQARVELEAPEPVEAGAEGELEAVVAGSESEAPPKKRTRRGSRGGRGRKRKPAATAEVTAGEAEPAVEVPLEPELEQEPEQQPPSPVIHVPERDLGEHGPDSSSNGDGPATPKKRTRRGSRGGRGRRRKQVADVAAASDAADVSSDGSQPSGNGSGEWEYTPMSEWASLDGRED